MPDDPPPSEPPLAGLRVLDLGRYYQAPYAAFLMAMAGADVVKIEALGGEPLRRPPEPGATRGRASYALAMLNSNKRGLRLDLKHEAGRELLLRLASVADVLLENFAPGALGRLGLGDEVLRASNSRLIHASGTGYGSHGPDRDALALDPVVQASSGITAVTGPPKGPPYKAGPSLVDFLSGVHLYAGVMAALYGREKSGRGRRVEVAMQEAVYPALTSCLATLYYTGRPEATRTGNGHHALSPYGLYRAADGHVAILCTTEQHWRRLARAMGRPELGDDARFSSNRSRRENTAALEAEIEAWSGARSRAEIFEAAKACGVVAAPVRRLDEVIDDPHMHERGMLVWVDHPDLGRVVLPKSPIRFDDNAGPELVPSAALGEHNAEVLGEWLGMTSPEIERLVRDDVI
ncbi:MAG: CoA transferase [Myxococcales bacterium]|nr:CoA transferase [Myxococcales bacterium]